VRIGAEEVRDAPPMAIGADARFFSGVHKRGERIIMMLDIDAVLSAAEKSQLRGLGEAP